MRLATTLCFLTVLSLSNASLAGTESTDFLIRKALLQQFISSGLHHLKGLIGSIIQGADNPPKSSGLYVSSSSSASNSLTPIKPNQSDESGGDQGESSSDDEDSSSDDGEEDDSYDNESSESEEDQLERAALLKELNEMADLAEKNKWLVILSLDIDGTILYEKSEYKKEIDHSYFPKQKLWHKVFNEWLQTGEGKNNFLVIYNTARKYTNHHNPIGVLGWLDLALPHVLISGNGLKVNMQHNVMPEALSSIKAHTYRLEASLTEQLTTQFTQNEESSIQLTGTSISGDVFQETHLKIQKFTKRPDFKHETFQIPITSTSIHYIPDTANDRIISPNLLNQYRSYFADRSGEHSRKLTYHFENASSPKAFSYFMDRTVNKGTTLALTIHKMQSFINWDQISAILLFTAGDDLPDTPMLRFDLLSQIFSPQSPKTIDDFYIPARNLEHNVADLSLLNIDRDTLASIQSFWQLGILPPLIFDHHEFIKSFIPDSGLTDTDKVVRTTEPGLRPLLVPIRKRLKQMEEQATHVSGLQMLSIH